ncbi:MAG: type II toxin-antitoxin system RelE/ParE family toxin [Candidatus Melainabacteria bacterium]|nr:type II toxin-antitoxin system RelE/ParE family toxin [Candidatus Melainabacteria bacterium]
MRITFSPASREDLQGIFNYIAQDNLDAAIAFVRQLKQRCTELAPLPNVGRKRDEIQRGYRSVVEGEYVIFYQAMPDGMLEIKRIIHSKRDLRKAFQG